MDEFLALVHELRGLLDGGHEAEEARGLGDMRTGGADDIAVRGAGEGVLVALTAFEGGEVEEIPLVPKILGSLAVCGEAGEIPGAGIEHAGFAAIEKHAGVLTGGAIGAVVEEALGGEIGEHLEGLGEFGGAVVARAERVVLGLGGCLAHEALGEDEGEVMSGPFLDIAERDGNDAGGLDFAAEGDEFGVGLWNHPAMLREELLVVEEEGTLEQIGDATDFAVENVGLERGGCDAVAPLAVIGVHVCGEVGDISAADEIVQHLLSGPYEVDVGGSIAAECDADAGFVGVRFEVGNFDVYVRVLLLEVGDDVIKRGLAGLSVPYRPEGELDGLGARKVGRGA